MPEVTFYGGVSGIGGNAVEVEEGDTKILLDFGKDFTAENEFFSEYLKPRKGNGLEDFFKLGFLPEKKGWYRKDYLRHEGREAAERPELDAVFITHGHVDHIGYIHFLRQDIPIYCTPTTKKIMEVRQEAGSFSFNEYIEKADTFHLRQYKTKEGLTKKTKRQESTTHERPVKTLEDGEKVEIGDIKVKALKVNHSVPGAAAFHIEAGGKSVAYTGDLRLHGYSSEDTENFIGKTEELQPDALVTEGTNTGEKDITTEREVRQKLAEHLEKEDRAAFINFPGFDLERMLSVLKAAEQNSRKLVIRTKQALLLKKLEENDLLPAESLSLKNDWIKVFQPKKGWGIATDQLKTPGGEWKKLEQLDIPEENREKLLKKDFKHWEKLLILEEDTVTTEKLRDSLDDFLVYMDYYNLNDLVDLEPEKGSFLWSRTEPFTEEMEIDLKRVHNWLREFDLSMKKAHASGHMSENQLAEMVRAIQPGKLLPVHTEDPDWFHRFATEIPEISYGKTLEV